MRKGDKTLQQVLKARPNGDKFPYLHQKSQFRLACPFKEREVAGHPVLHAANPPPVVLVY